MQRKSVSVDSGIDRGVTGASPTVTSGKLNRRDNVSMIHGYNIPIQCTCECAVGLRNF